MKIGSILLLSFALLAQITITNQTQKEDSIFPKILWAYWDSSLDHAYFFTKLCINNMIHFSNESKWKFMFLTKENVTNYLSNQSKQRIQKIARTKYYPIGNQQLADLYRLFLIYEHGGMWLDSNSFFLGNFTWIQKIDQQTGIVNKLNSPPQFLGFTYNLYSGNKSRTFDKTYNEQIEFFPGLQIWFFVSKKGSLFLKDLLENIQYSLQKEKSELDRENANFKYNFQDLSYFVISNYNFQTVLQKKQKEIQTYPQRFQTKYAVDYYKLWTIEGQVSAFSHAYLYFFDTTSIFNVFMYQNLEDYLKPYNFKKYFFKNNGQIYYPMRAKFDLLPYLYCTQQVKKFDENSIFNQILFKYSENVEEIKRLRALNSIHEMDLNNEYCSQKVRFIIDRLVRFAKYLMIILLFLYFLVRQANKIDDLLPQQVLNKIKI